MNKKLIQNISFAPMVIAILCLVIILFSFEKIAAYHNERVLKHTLPSNDKNSIFNGWTTLKKYKSKKQIDFTLNGNWQDESTFEKLRSSAIKMKHSGDTNTIYRVHLSDNTSYGEIIRLLNIMLLDDHKIYVILENDFYLFPPTTFGYLQKQKDSTFLIFDL